MQAGGARSEAGVVHQIKAERPGRRAAPERHGHLLSPVLRAGGRSRSRTRDHGRERWPDSAASGPALLAAPCRKRPGEGPGQSVGVSVSGRPRASQARNRGSSPRTPTMESLMPSRKEVHAKYMREVWYPRNKEKHSALVRERAKWYRAVCSEVVAALKNRPCSDCGLRFDPVAMDFDHVRGNKRKDVSVMAHTGYPLRLILAEIVKCELVCSNCHRVRTLKRRQNCRGEAEEAEAPGS